MKKFILSMVFATLFIACADNNVCVAPEYTQPIQDSTYTQPGQDTTYNPVYDTTYTQPIQDTTHTTSYRLLIGGVCSDMNVQSIGIMTSDSVARSFVGTWKDICVFRASEPVSYIEDNYTLYQIVTILMDNLSFDSNMVNSLFTEVNNSGAIVYIYNTNSGLNFLYIRRLVEY